MISVLLRLVAVVVLVIIAAADFFADHPSPHLLGWFFLAMACFVASFFTFEGVTVTRR